MPGGNAFYPSSLLMNVIPAQCAGVENIYVTTPLKNNRPVKDEILTILQLLNIDRIYHIGGAHAIAAFAVGTKEIPKVYKICGPGNIHVAMAKKLVSTVLGMTPEQFKPFTAEMIAKLRISDEGQEGMDAFLNKRKPKWAKD